MSEGKSQVRGLVGKKVGPGSSLRKARSGILFEGRPGLGPQLRNKVGQDSSLVGAERTRSP